MSFPPKYEYTASMALKFDELERKMFQITKNTLIALRSENNFPYHSYQETNMPQRHHYKTSWQQEE